MTGRGDTQCGSSSGRDRSRRVRLPDREAAGFAEDGKAGQRLLQTVTDSSSAEKDERIAGQQVAVGVALPSLVGAATARSVYVIEPSFDVDPVGASVAEIAA